MTHLQDRFMGCLAGSRLGSAMGAAVEGWSKEDIVAKYGVLRSFEPYHHYKYKGVEWVRNPGTTEDGIERQKFLCYAIINKQDRVVAEDVKALWVERGDPDKYFYMSEPFETVLLQMARAGVPAGDLGRYCPWVGLNSFARSCHPIGLINAGDPAKAVQDVYDVGRLYQPAGVGEGLMWAGIVAAGIAAACEPNVSVDHVIDAATRHCNAAVRKEVDRALDIAARHRDPLDMREEFYQYYTGQGMTYAYSFANEVVAKGLAIFAVTKGHVEEALVGAVNFGRDTDCLASVAAGLSGAYGGTTHLSREWIETVDNATLANPHTHFQDRLADTADQLHGAFQARIAHLSEYYRAMAS